MPSDDLFVTTLKLEEFLKKFTEIERQIVILDKEGQEPGRLENDAEHTYKCLVLALLLVPELYPNLSKAETLEMIYAIAGHDLIEVEAGDTSFWGSQKLRDSQPSREEAALAKLMQASEVPKTIRQATASYLAQASLPVRIAYAVDKIEPILTNIVNRGGIWKRLKVTTERYFKRTQEVRDKLEATPEFLPLLDTILDYLRQHPEYFYQLPRR